ncbi:MAG: NAD+ synthase [Proteobacteria bacterium]|nr:NAD+ synthase [Pseudomonadota bacterium]
MTLRIALAQFDFPVGAVHQNAERIAAMIATARDQHGADLVLFPELALSGYPPEDLLMRPAFLADCEAALQQVAASTEGIVAVLGWPQAAGSIVYNAASVLRDGRVAGTYRKQQLPNYAVFDERRYFATGDRPCVFDVGGVTVGMVICEDLGFARPLTEPAAAGASLVLVPNASPFETDKRVERDRLLAMRAAETLVHGRGIALAYLNVVGGQDAVVFDGASVLVDGDGRVHPQAEAFQEHWLVADYDAESRSFIQVNWPCEGDEDQDSLSWRAIVLGTRDYVEKNGFREIVLGLSGGIDSTLVVLLAVDALGPDRVNVVVMPSRYTADLSNDLAAEQCEALGARLLTLPIEEPFEGYLAALSELFADQPVDTTEENLQARTRGALLMALTNKFHGLLLTTGNKSEYAVGYATIYGDMCGGFAPIKDLYKTEVFALARWRNAQSQAPVIPPAVIDRPPSAELRENQKDQDSLPPYEELDGILKRYIDRQHSREEIVDAGFDPDTVDKILRLVRISEWKRQQSAPGPKVSHLAFGRERRYPISNGYRG